MTLTYGNGEGYKFTKAEQVKFEDADNYPAGGIASNSAPSGPVSLMLYSAVYPPSTYARSFRYLRYRPRTRMRTARTERRA